MLMRAIGQLSGILISIVGIFVLLLFMQHQSDKADSRFEIRILKNISEIGRELKETELEDKTVHTIKYTLEDLYWNVESYVNEKLFCESFSVLFLVPMFMFFFESVRRICQKKAFT